MATTADDPTFFQIQSQSLAFLGLDITTKANSKWKRVLGICNCICAALFLSLCFSQLKVVSQGNDLQLQVLCFLISMIIGVFLANVKMNSIRSQSKDFIELSTLLKDLYLNVDSNDREKLRGVNKLAQIMAWVNLVCLLSSTTLLIFYPLKVAIEQFYDEGFFYWPHPFPTAIPFVDTSAFPVHALIHLLFIYGLVAISFAICAADSLFVETSLLLSCHFQLLQRNIEALNYEDMDEELRRIFLYHRNILKTKDALLRSYRKILSIFSLVAHVMFGLFVICALQSSGFEAFKSVGYAFSTMCQILFYTYGGDIITHESQNICGSYYNSRWFEATPKPRKEIVTAIVLSQGGTVLHGGLVVLNLRTTARILSSTYSLVTVIYSAFD